MSLTSLVRKAKRLIPFAELTGISDLRNQYFYSFPSFKNSKIDLTIGTEDGKTKLQQCTCKYHSVSDVKCTSLCSYYLAVLFKIKEKLK